MTERWSEAVVVLVDVDVHIDDIDALIVHGDGGDSPSIRFAVRQPAASAITAARVTESIVVIASVVRVAYGLNFDGVILGQAVLILLLVQLRVVLVLVVRSVLVLVLVMRSVRMLVVRFVHVLLLLLVPVLLLRHVLVRMLRLILRWIPVQPVGRVFVWHLRRVLLLLLRSVVVLLEVGVAVVVVGVISATGVVGSIGCCCDSGLLQLLLLLRGLLLLLRVLQLLLRRILMRMLMLLLTFGKMLLLKLVRVMPMKLKMLEVMPMHLLLLWRLLQRPRWRCWKNMVNW